MKYLVLLIVLVVAVGVWRSRRSADDTPPQQTPRQPAPPQDILACAHCGVHIPQADALMLGSQAYCCREHRNLGPA